jgi:hypothetical protein
VPDKRLVVAERWAAKEFEEKETADAGYPT